MSTQALELFPSKVALCIVDVQEKLAATMPEKIVKGTLRNCLNLIESARVFNLPVVLSEHLPELMGDTLPVVAESVLRLPRERVFFGEKTSFNCAAEAKLAAWISQTGRTQWVICGMETHVSVYQTARALLQLGYEVHVPRDAVVSRTPANWEVGLQLIDRCGAVVTSTETIVFDLLKDSGAEEFKPLSKIVK